MKINTLPEATITIPTSAARRYLLKHQKLTEQHLPTGKDQVYTTLRHLGSIQFDPVQVTGTNHDLVLQARIADYQPDMLDQLLYQERTLLEGYDKMLCIYPAYDWPAFTPVRDRMKVYNYARLGTWECLKDEVFTFLEANDYVDSKTFQFKSINAQEKQIDWHWAPASLSKAVLEAMYYAGDLIIHHREGKRRFFGLPSRLLQKEILQTPPPYAGEQEFRDWHILRRIRSIGCLYSKSTDFLNGLYHTKTPELIESINRLAAQNRIICVALEENPEIRLILQADALQELKQLADLNQQDLPNRATFLGPLDNLLWDRKLIEQVFHFSYTWEIYTPAKKRKYGHYVLPVLYKDRFAARFSPVYDRKTSTLTFGEDQWWWEEGVQHTNALFEALEEALTRFTVFLDPEQKGNTHIPTLMDRLKRGRQT